jgi:Fe-S-cluster containining protein
MQGSSRQANPPEMPSSRQCGPCNLCCTAMHVAALDKPAGTPCEHQGKAAGGGCGVYDHRPSVCRNWYCMWVRDNGKVFADDERPDKLGVFFTAGRKQSTPSSRLASLTTPLAETDEHVIYVHPVRANGERSVAARVVINRMRRYFRSSFQNNSYRLQAFYFV